MGRKIVVALGGNAILVDSPTAEAQKEAVRKTAEELVKFIENGYELIVTHGNGPQVGNLLLQNLEANSKKNPAFPLDSLVAMTEGSIGYWLQNTLQNALTKRKIDKQVATVITQVIVDQEDPAFQNPTKPIGPFYSEEEAEEEMKKGSGVYKEDANRGWRKVVPSPKPKGIKEIETISKLVDMGQIVIAAGGGGISVTEEKDGQLEGVEAVIDKDFASQQLANQLDAELFIILTGVDHVYVNYNQPDQKKLEKVTVEELHQYIEQNQFSPGSMLPKVEAAIDFVNKGENNKTVITSLEKIEQFISSNTGTIITK